ncbi:MAG: hypothetical protein GY953_16610, partial [bacterium]|nr:hypothetical protein [bacterium]
PAALAGMALLALVVVFRKPNLGRLVIFGSAGFGLFYTIVLVVCFALWPQLATQWNAANLSGLLVWIIPGEEIAWAFTAGGAFPLVMAYALDADLASRSVHSDRSQSRLYLAEPPPASDG